MPDDEEDTGRRKKRTTGNRKKGDNKNEALSSKSFFAILPDIFYKQIFINYTLYKDGKLVSIPHTIFHFTVAIFCNNQ